MKKIIRLLFLALVLLFPACEKDEPVNVESFVEQVQMELWQVDRYDVYFADGEVWESEDIVGGSFVDNMLFMPDGICRMYIWSTSVPYVPVLYKSLEWNFEGNVLHLYDPKDQTLGARGQLQLLKFKNGRFVMKGYQPNGLDVPDYYSIIYGHIETDPEVVERYLSYEAYYRFREEHPELWEPNYQPTESEQ